MIKKRGGKFGTFDFALPGGLCGRGKSKCAKCEVAENSNFFVRWKKN